MPYEVVHFRESDEILKGKEMEKEVKAILDHIDQMLQGSFTRKKELRPALQQMGWRKDGTLEILEQRKYQYTGYKNRVALEANFSYYEAILGALFRLQIGYDKGRLDTGLVLLTGLRGRKTPYGSTVELVEWEVEHLFPTISMPVSIALFDVRLV